MVGALARIVGTAQVRSLASGIMTILKHIHEHDLVHCNMGLDNVVRPTIGWLLIGLEPGEQNN